MSPPPDTQVPPPRCEMAGCTKSATPRYYCDDHDALCDPAAAIDAATIPVVASEFVTKGTAYVMPDRPTDAEAAEIRRLIRSGTPEIDAIATVMCRRAAKVTLNPSPDTVKPGTLGPGQRCTRTDVVPDHEHRFNPEWLEEWESGRAVGSRCPYIQPPEQPPASKPVCGTCGGSRKVWAGAPGWPPYTVECLDCATEVECTPGMVAQTKALVERLGRERDARETAQPPKGEEAPSATIAAALLDQLVTVRELVLALKNADDGQEIFAAKQALYAWLEDADGR